MKAVRSVRKKAATTSYAPTSAASVDVAITGYSLRVCGDGFCCPSVPEFARYLETNCHSGSSNKAENSQRTFETFSTIDLDGQFFQCRNEDGGKLLPQTRVLLQVTYEALLDARISIKTAGRRCGLYIHNDARNSIDMKEPYRILSEFYAFESASMKPLSYSTSLSALRQAVTELQNGMVDRAIVCSVNIPTDMPQKCPSSEIAVCFIVERGMQGYARIVGLEVDGGMKQPNDTNTRKLSIRQQTQFMRGVLSGCNIKPKEVIYHEADYDLIDESLASLHLQRISNNDIAPLRIGGVSSVVSNIGDSIGMLGIVKIMFSFETTMLYSSGQFLARDKFTWSNEVIEDWAPGICTLSGSNRDEFAIILPALAKKKIAIEAELSVPFAASAAAPAPSPYHGNLYALQHSLGNHETFEFMWRQNQWKRRDPIVFVLSGWGSQWNSMGKDLMKTSTVFATAIATVEANSGIPLRYLFEDGGKWMDSKLSAIGIISFQIGIISMLKDAGVRPDQIIGHDIGEITCAYLSRCCSVAQALEMALVKVELAQMVDPRYRLVVYKKKPSQFDFTTSRLPGDTKQREHVLYVKREAVLTPVGGNCYRSYSLNGKMVVLECTENRICEALNRLRLKETCIACYNSKDNHTVSGPLNEIQTLVDHLLDCDPGLNIQYIATGNIAYYSPTMQLFREFLEHKINKIVQPCSIPKLWNAPNAVNFDTNLVVSAMIDPVKLYQSIKTLPNTARIIAVGPGGSLLGESSLSQKCFAVVDTDEKKTNINTVTKGIMHTYQDKKGSDYASSEDVTTIFGRYASFWTETFKSVTTEEPLKPTYPAVVAKDNNTNQCNPLQPSYMTPKDDNSIFSNREFHCKNEFVATGRQTQFHQHSQNLKDEVATGTDESYYSSQSLSKVTTSTAQTAVNANKTNKCMTSSANISETMKHEACVIPTKQQAPPNCKKNRTADDYDIQGDAPNEGIPTSIQQIHEADGCCSDSLSDSEVVCRSVDDPSKLIETSPGFTSKKQQKFDLNRNDILMPVVANASSPMASWSSGRRVAATALIAFMNWWAVVSATRISSYILGFTFFFLSIFFGFGTCLPLYLQHRLLSSPATNKKRGVSAGDGVIVQPRVPALLIQHANSVLASIIYITLAFVHGPGTVGVAVWAGHTAYDGMSAAILDWNVMESNQRKHALLRSTMTFFVLGVWVLFVPMDRNDDIWKTNSKMYTAVMIWLTSSTWSSLNTLVRLSCPTIHSNSNNALLTARNDRVLQLLVFSMERVQRVVAYLMLISITGADSILAFVVALSLILLDGFDCYFQFHTTTPGTTLPCDCMDHSSLPSSVSSLFHEENDVAVLPDVTGRCSPVVDGHHDDDVEANVENESTTNYGTSDPSQEAAAVDTYNHHQSGSSSSSSSSEMNIGVIDIIDSKAVKPKQKQRPHHFSSSSSYTEGTTTRSFSSSSSSSSCAT